MNSVPGAAVELVGVTRDYQLGDETFHALDGVDLTVRPGEWLSIVGPSGSGKSTLANVVGGLDRPTRGTVRVDGHDINTLSDRALSAFRNQRIGFVFQSFNLRGDSTALENVMLPLVLARMKTRARRERASSCLEQVGLGDRMHHLPSQLSGGQRQRVAIARALANEPSLLLADEPTGNLDSSRGEEVMALLAELNRTGLTLLVITHDERVAARSHRTIEVLDGRIQERTGAPA